jgi:hypothetical protein
LTKNLQLRLWLAVCCCLPILVGCVFLPYAGLEMDETLFTLPYYQPGAEVFRVRLFHHNVPLMIMTYVGALKTFLYWPLFAVFRSSIVRHPMLAAWVMRLPMVLVACLTVFVFFHMAEGSAGRRAAAVATLLLACDPTFLLTDTFDWGPVALEHLLLVTACFFLIKYAHEHIPRDLLLAFFILGLALWNKAVFGWALAGLICGGGLIFWRDIIKLATPRRLLCAVACFGAGALPLVVYNARHEGVTFQSNANLEPSAVPAKFIQLDMALNGSGLFAFLVSEEYYDNPKPPSSVLGQAAFWIRRHFGDHHEGYMDYAAALALLAVPLWWRSRAARFCIVFTAAAWLLMASTRGAGTSQHHAVLLWPFPQLFVAIVISSLRWKWVVACVCTILAASNLLVLNQYLVQFERNGADGPFTDAINRLSAALPLGQTIYVLDWGIQYPLYVLRNGRLSMPSVQEFFASGVAAEQSRDAIKMMAEKDALFVTHAEKREVFEGMHQRFDEAAAAVGCHETSVQTIPDSNGRPVFRVFKIACADGG